MIASGCRRRGVNDGIDAGKDDESSAAHEAGYHAGVPAPSFDGARKCRQCRRDQMPKAGIAATRHQADSSRQASADFHRVIRIIIAAEAFCPARYDAIAALPGCHNIDCASEEMPWRRPRGAR